MLDPDGPGQSYNSRSPVVIDSGPDSDDALWGHFGPDDDEVEVVDDPPTQPVASSSTHVVRQPDVIPVDNARASESLNELMKRSYYNDLVKIRESVFGIRSWRENQLEIICSIMDGNDTFNLMPTGGGKSLTFQLPAIVMSRLEKQITIVISPLIALMTDQEQGLERRGIKALILNSDAKNRMAPMFDRENPPELVYVTPERVVDSTAFQNALLHLYRHGRLFMLAVDEAHTLVSWGNTFRDKVGRVLL